MKRIPFASTAHDLHAAAQIALCFKEYNFAAELFMAAADVALTPGGRRVLLEKAVDAAAWAEMPPAEPGLTLPAFRGFETAPLRQIH